MSNGFHAIDLSGLPAPEVVEPLEYETILAAMVRELTERDPAFTALVESDPAYKVLEVAAYREVLLRQRVNDAARAVMVAYAGGSDLDNLAALVPLARKTVHAGDPDAFPPVPPTYESDADFRRRVQLAPEGFSVAGPDGAYIFHALAVTGVKDAAPVSPAPVDVELYILGTEGNGVPSAEVLQAVSAKFADQDIRPLTDRVTVKPAEVVEYDVSATIHMMTGPSPESVKQAARKDLEKYVAERHKLGLGAAISGIYEALHISGVVRVELHSPAADVAVQTHQAAFCRSISINMSVS